jgi:hypothetical protein
MEQTLVPLIRRPLLEAGYSEGEIRRLRRSGMWATLRRGSYLDAQTFAPLDARQRHALLLHAAVARLSKPAVVSHCSAAVLLGIPLWSTHLGTVHLTRQPPARSGGSAGLTIHAARLQPHEIVDVDGFSVTSAARTIADLGRSLPFEQAVVAADAALRLGLTSRAMLDESAARSIGLPGSRSMARALRFADGGGDSVGESRSRVLLHQAGLPTPTLQFEVKDSAGMVIGRTDFAWREGRLLGEFDGQIKYGRLLRPGESAGDAVFREKRREDALRDTGARVIRWVWAELDHPHQLARRIQHALDRL